MKNIKFRCLNKHTNKMINAERLRNMGRFALSNDYCPSKFLVLPYPQDGYILMQYTGLHDKNGVEIYEGDIVHIKIGKKRTKTPIEYTEEVIFNKGKFRTKNVDHLVNSEGWYEFEVVGNIYENKELLNG